LYFSSIITGSVCGACIFNFSCNHYFFGVPPYFKNSPPECDNKEHVTHGDGQEIVKPEGIDYIKSPVQEIVEGQIKHPEYFQDLKNSLWPSKRKLMVTGVVVGFVLLLLKQLGSVDFSKMVR